MKYMATIYKNMIILLFVLFPEYYLYKLWKKYKEPYLLNKMVLNMAFLWILVKIYLIVEILLTELYNWIFFTHMTFVVLFVMIMSTCVIIANIKNYAKYNKNSS